jgi:hypothetical protein
MNKKIRKCPLCENESLECVGHAFGGYEDYDWDDYCQKCGYWAEQHYSKPLHGVGDYVHGNEGGLYLELSVVRQLWNNKTTECSYHDFWKTVEDDLLKIGFEKCPWLSQSPIKAYSGD